MADGDLVFPNSIRRAKTTTYPQSLSNRGFQGLEQQTARADKPDTRLLVDLEP